MPLTLLGYKSKFWCHSSALFSAVSDSDCLPATPIQLTNEAFPSLKEDTVSVFPNLIDPNLWLFHKLLRLCVDSRWQCWHLAGLKFAIVTILIIWYCWGWWKCNSFCNYSVIIQITRLIEFCSDGNGWKNMLTAIHSKGKMNVCIEFHGNLSNRYWDISLESISVSLTVALRKKSVNSRSDRIVHPGTTDNCTKNFMAIHPSIVSDMFQFELQWWTNWHYMPSHISYSQ